MHGRTVLMDGLFAPEGHTKETKPKGEDKGAFLRSNEIATEAERVEEKWEGGEYTPSNRELCREPIAKAIGYFFYTYSSAIICLC